MSNSLNKKLIIIVSFITLTVFTTIVLGYVLLWGSIGVFYHPGAFELNYGLKFIWVFFLILAVNWFFAVGMMIFGLARTDIRQILYSTGVFIFVILMFLLLYHIPTHHMTRFYLGDDMYAIPTEYGPRNGSENPGGSLIVVETIGYPDLRPVYWNQDLLRTQTVISDGNRLMLAIKNNPSDFLQQHVDFERKDMLQVIERTPIDTKPHTLNADQLSAYQLKYLGKPDEFFYFQRNQNGDIQMLGTCSNEDTRPYSHCNIAFTDGRYSYSLYYSGGLIDFEKEWPELQTRVPNFFEQFKQSK